MQEKVLVTYATKYGSTQEVAEAIAEVFKERGVPVDLQPVRTVRSLEDYRAVVLGAPLYIGRWLKDAQRFLLQHEKALSERRVALFTLGPAKPDESDWQEARTQLDKELADHPKFQPEIVELFGGMFDPAKLRFPDSLFGKMAGGGGAMDARDWLAIRAWANRIADQW